MKTLLFITTAVILLLSGCAAVGPADGSRCEFCDITIGQILPEGGLVFSKNNDLISQKTASNLATMNCRLRGFAVASMDNLPHYMNSISKWQHHYSCSNGIPIPAPLQNNRDPFKPDAPISLDKIDLAKDKCKELGLKQGTEQFGNCVLKLSK